MSNKIPCIISLLVIIVFVCLFYGIYKHYIRQFVANFSLSGGSDYYLQPNNYSPVFRIDDTIKNMPDDVYTLQELVRDFDRKEIPWFNLDLSQRRYTEDININIVGEKGINEENIESLKEALNTLNNPIPGVNDEMSTLDNIVRILNDSFDGQFGIWQYDNQFLGISNQYYKTIINGQPQTAQTMRVELTGIIPTTQKANIWVIECNLSNKFVVDFRVGIKSPTNGIFCLAKS